jgi:leucine-zipper of insertion element IS481
MVPDTWVTLSRLFREEVWEAVEGECSVMDERLQFGGRRPAGEPMAELCRAFGISRKPGDKIFAGYQQCGVQGLTDRSRPPVSVCASTPVSGGELHPQRQARVPERGCADHGQWNHFLCARLPHQWPEASLYAPASSGTERVGGAR